MKRATKLPMAIFIGLMIIGLTFVQSYGEGNASEKTMSPVQANYGKLPMHFEENQGQTNPEVKFFSRGRGYTLFLTSTEAVMALIKSEEPQPPDTDGEGNVGYLEKTPDKEKKREIAVLRMKWVKSKQQPKFSGVTKLPGHSNYFIGNDSSKWVRNVPHYAQVQINEIYPGVDLVFYGAKQGNLEYDLVVAPGVDPHNILMEFNGQDRTEIDKEGNLILHMGKDKVVSMAPAIYQRIGDEKKIIKGRYVQKGEGHLGLEIAPYDKNKLLIIDPVLIYSTYLGGSSFDQAQGIAVDETGSAYVTGGTSSIDFPLENPFQVTYATDGDAFITKLAPSGQALVYSTYLGGSNSEGGQSIAVDGEGSAYVTGATSSNDFPTMNPFQAVHGTLLTVGDAFVTKLAPSGQSLVYSTYLGGYESDNGQAITVDKQGSAYVTGNTRSTDFPLKNPFQDTIIGSIPFITKFDPSGQELIYSTYLGGSDNKTTQSRGIAVDEQGSAYVVGVTYSNDFPLKNPFQGTNQGVPDLFLTKFDPFGQALIYSTYLGGSGGDCHLVGCQMGIAIDKQGSAYVTGSTRSTDFPTKNAFQAARAGGDSDYSDAFVTKFDPSGQSLAYSTYLGGNRSDVGFDVAVDRIGSAYVTGQTTSTNFPIMNPLQAELAGTNDIDIYVTKFHPSGQSLLYSTYLGGDDPDSGVAIVVDEQGSAYVAGYTNSGDFPLENPFQEVYNNIFVLKIAEDIPDIDPPTGSIVGGTGIVLTAVPESNSTFAGWSGDPDCIDGVVTMNADVTCTATFNLKPIPPVLLLDPPLATNPVGVPHTVTATLLQATTPLEGVTVAFTVTGANPTTGSCTTTSDGHCTFVYTGLSVGTDEVGASATGDFDGDGISETISASPVTMTWEPIPENKPPVPNAGLDQTVECTGPTGAIISLDGTESSDPEGDFLNFFWEGPFPEGNGTVTGSTPTVTLPNGSFTINMIVSDSAGNVATDSVAVIVQDTTSPTLTVPDPLTIQATDLSGVPKSDPTVAAFLSGATAMDLCDAVPAIAHNAPSILPVGTTLVTFKATDASGNQTEATATVTVLSLEKSPDYYLGYELQPARKIQTRDLELSNRFVQGIKPARIISEKLFNPMYKKDEEISYKEVHLESYTLDEVGVKQGLGIPYKERETVEIKNLFHTIRVIPLHLHSILVPTVKSRIGPVDRFPENSPVDHYLCYKIATVNQEPLPPTVNIKNQVGEQMSLKFEALSRLCSPVEKKHRGKVTPIKKPDKHLVCYQVLGVPSKDLIFVNLNNQFGSERGQLKRANEFCVPSVRNSVEGFP